MEEHVLSGSILNTWAVVGAAVGCGSQGKPGKIPLVRAQLTGGGTVVGVRVRPEHLSEVRYALAALGGSKSVKQEVPDSLEQALQAAKDAAAPAVALVKAESSDRDVRTLSAALEAILQVEPGRTARWHGWAGAHKALLDRELVLADAQGMASVQDAMEDLRRNGKLNEDAATGEVTLREKPKGSGWYIPPPKKPKASVRGRGRGRGRA